MADLFNGKVCDDCMKKVFVAFLISSIIFYVAGCSENKTSVKANINTDGNVTSTDLNSEDKNIVLNIDCKADQIKNYDSIDLLCDDADFIFKGTVLSYKSDVFDSAGTILTDYKFKIDEVLTNKINYNKNTMTIREPGGIVEYKYYSQFVSDEKDFYQGPPVNSNDYENGFVKFTYNSAPLLQKGKSYVIFVDKYEADGKVEYLITGNYQGTFWENQKNGKMERHSLKSSKDNIAKMDSNNFEKSVKSKSNKRK